ncbi:hypothetical protein C8F01DRAFT_419871 [Mycena amicta]|nr:hypothetical protein C8F01DRAFT_419871 [Mycena amicta]
MRTELCEELAQKAPHHTAQSWRAYWCSNHDLPDKILARARNDLDQNLTQPRPGMRQQHVYGEHDSDSELSEPPSEEEESDVDDEELEIPTDDESKMGEAGSPYTDADLGCVVRHIASFSNWEDASYKEKWHAFAEKYSQRSHKSWNEYYRRSEKRILQLARKVQKMKSSEPARRTWGMEAKRKLSEEVDGRDAKRNRT